jgi:hypothetical protein
MLHSSQADKIASVVDQMESATKEVSRMARSNQKGGAGAKGGRAPFYPPPNRTSKKSSVRQGHSGAGGGGTSGGSAGGGGGRHDDACTCDGTAGPSDARRGHTGPQRYDGSTARKCRTYPHTFMVHARVLALCHLVPHDSSLVDTPRPSQVTGKTARRGRKWT